MLAYTRAVVLQRCVILPSSGCLVISGDTLAATAGRRDATGIKWAEAWDAAKQPAVHRAAPYNKELAHPKWVR